MPYNNNRQTTKPKGEAPVFKDFAGNLTISVWPSGFAIQQRKKNDKGEFETVATIRGYKKDAALLSVFLANAYNICEYPQKGESESKGETE